MKRRLLLLFLVTVLIVTVVLGQRLCEGPGWFAGSPHGPCAPIHAEVYRNGGWKAASCSDLMEVLAKQRDVRSVSMTMKPTVGNLLAYPQYDRDFQIEPADFADAQCRCREVVKSGLAHPDVLAHCRSVVAGKVPFGLKLKGKPFARFEQLPDPGTRDFDKRAKSYVGKGFNHVMFQDAPTP